SSVSTSGRPVLRITTARDFMPAISWPRDAWRQAADLAARLRARGPRLAHTRCRIRVLAKKKRCGAVRVPLLHEEVARVRVGAADDVVVVPLRPEADVDREGDEWAPGPIERRRRLENADATFDGRQAGARKAAVCEIDARERLDEPLLDAVLHPHGERRLI